MQERGIEVDHSTLNRWVLKYAPELDLRIRPHLQPTKDSWRVDQTYVKVKGVSKYLYRAVDSAGNTLEFMLSAKRDNKAAKRFFRKALKAKHTQSPRVVTRDKNAADPKAIETLKGDKTLRETTELGQKKYLNNIIEQDHRAIKRLTNAGRGFKSFNTARRTLKGFEAMNMLRKGQVKGVTQGDGLGQAQFIAEIFGVFA